MRLPRLALIGAGNMGEALLKGLLDQGVVEPAQVAVAEKAKARGDDIARRYGVAAHETVADACRGAGLVLLAVKPQDVDAALRDLGPWEEGKVLVSVCAGVTLGHLAAALPAGSQVVRVMPNTPALVGCGASVYCPGPTVTPEGRAAVEILLGAVGEVHAVEKEGLLDAVTGLSGSGPGYTYVFLEALADAGVLMGLPRELARALASQTVYGTARMARDASVHTGELRDRVASPGGTTIAGLRELELRGFRGAVIEAVRAATLRSRELGG